MKIQQQCTVIRLQKKQTWQKGVSSTRILRLTKEMQHHRAINTYLHLREKQLSAFETDKNKSQTSELIRQKVKNSL